MLQYLILVLVLLGLAASGTRRGVSVVILAAVLQDVARKLDPSAGRGVLWTTLAGLALVATFFGMVVRGERVPLAHAGLDRLRRPLIVLLFIVVLQSVVAYVRTKSAAVPIVGISMYLFPILALDVGLSMGRRPGAIEAMLKTYIVVVTPALVCIVLAHFGVKSTLFDPIGMELVAYAPGLGRIHLEQGLFRAPEIAGWHASMGLITCILWSGQGWRGAWMILFGVFGLGALWTGRRKWLVAPAVVLVGASALTAWLGIGRVKALVRTSLIAVVILIVMLTLTSVGTDNSVQNAHLFRLRLLEEHSGSRFQSLGADGPLDVIERVGWLGGGVGIAQQGTRHFAGAAGAEIAGWGAEGGIGQILAELGVPGLLAGILSLIAVVRALGAGLRRAATAADAQGTWLLAWGLAVLLANVVTFALAKQAYGDPFIVGWLGLLTGCLLARAGTHAGGAMAPVASRRPLRIEVTRA
jgi:hypothetical protein